MKFPALALVTTLAALGSAALAGPLKEATISQIVNDVKVVEPRVGARPAALQDSIKDDLGVATGVQSRAELLFQDKTLTRLGAETFFSFQPGTRNLNLDRGSMLLQVPKNLGGARIRAASVTASITGTTIMLEHQRGSSVKIVVLEGSLQVSLDRRPGEVLNLRAGKMAVMNPEAKELPKPVDVDLRKVVRTSALVDPARFSGKGRATVAALPSMGLIESEIVAQDGRLKSTGATAASLVNPLIATEGADELRLKLVTTATSAASPDPTTGSVVPASERVASIDALKDSTSATSAGTTAAAAVPAVSTTVASTEDKLTERKSRDTTLSGLTIGNSGAGSLTTIDTSRTNSGNSGSGSSDNGSGSSGSGSSGSGSGSGGNGAGSSGSGSGSSGSGSGSNGSGSGSSGSGSRNIGSVAVTPPAFIAAPSPYIIGGKTSFNTAALTIVTNGVTDAGGLYRSAADNGPASTYLFPTASAYDAGTGLDGKFGAMSGGSIPSSGVAVYRFDRLGNDNAPDFNVAGGANDLALIAGAGMTMGSSGSPWTVDALHSLFLGTDNGPLTLSTEIRTKSLTGDFRYLQLYSRGANGFATLDGKISTPHANVFVDAEQGITLTKNASVTASNVVLNSPGAVLLEKAPTSASLTITSGTGIRVSRELASASVHLTAPRLETTVDLAALGGSLKIGAGGIGAGAQALGGFTEVEVAGDVVAGSLSVSGALKVDGTFRTGATSGEAVLSASSLVVGGGVDLTGATVKGKVNSGGALTVRATDVNVTSTGINGITANGADGLAGGGSGGTVNLGTTASPIGNSVTVERPISATTGGNGSASAGGDGGKVNVVARGTIAVNAAVKVSDSAANRASRSGGSIRLESRRTSGAAITVNSSGQLLALLDAASPGAGGSINFTSAGGDILVNGGTIRADKGNVDIRNNGVGNVALNNAAIRGDVVKVGALGGNGQLIIGGGTISADTSLKLYGGTSNGQVRFTDDVTLGGTGAKTIAGKTVTIDPAKTVTIGGSTAAKVYTDRGNYTGSGGNGSSSGKFGGAGATTQPYCDKPNF